jgi:hypothetical protein
MGDPILALSKRVDREHKLFWKLFKFETLKELVALDHKEELLYDISHESFSLDLWQRVFV